MVELQLWRAQMIGRYLVTGYGNDSSSSPLSGDQGLGQEGQDKTSALAEVFYLTGF